MEWKEASQNSNFQSNRMRGVREVFQKKELGPLRGTRRTGDFFFYLRECGKKMTSMKEDRNGFKN